MMFILRSVFWLGIAFVAIAPHANIQDVARQAPWTALSATQSAMATYTPHLVCESFECIAARTALAAANQDARVAAPAASPALVAEIDDELSPLIEALVDATPAPGSSANAPTPLPRPAGL